MSSGLTKRILVVDDDENLLKAIVRNLHKQFDITTVPSGFAALVALREDGPFAVVVSDMRMPEMTGVEFLAKAKAMDPYMVRIMLTGNADMETAVDAVNEGDIFRFLRKPCRADVLGESISEAMEAYNLRKGEQILLEETLRGSVKVLVELLGLVNPLAFSKAERMARIVRHLVKELAIQNPWEFEVAALLSQLGSITLSQEILEKEINGLALEEKESAQVKQSIHLSMELIQTIPRLEGISRMIAAGVKEAPDAGGMDSPNSLDRVKLGSLLLSIANAYDTLANSLETEDKLAEKLASSFRKYPKEVHDVLAGYQSSRQKSETQLVTLEKLKKNTVLEGPVFDMKGTLLAAQGQEVTDVMIQRLQAFSTTVGVKEPIRVSTQT